MSTRYDIAVHQHVFQCKYDYVYIKLNKIIKRIEHKITRILHGKRENAYRNNTNQDQYENRFECIYSNIQVTGIELIS